MLLVRLLDRQRGLVETLRFVISDDGEVGILAGDPGVLDFDRVLPTASGEVTRELPRTWLRALAAAEGERFELHLREVPRAAAARPAENDPNVAAARPAENDPNAAAASPAENDPRQLSFTGGVPGWKRRRARLAAQARLGMRRRPRIGPRGGKALSAAPAPGTPRASLSGEQAPSVARVSDGLPAIGGAAGSRSAGAATSGSGGAGSRLMRNAAANAALELAGTGDGSLVAWNPRTGLWGDGNPAAWWQSAIDLYSLVRYLEVAHKSTPAYQRLIETTYRLNISLPGTNMPRDFANEFMDDTAWWGIAWLEASEYELGVRHDVRDARRFLAVAEWDASYIYSRPRPCRTEGIEWQIAYPPDTITNAEFITLAARLALLRQQPGALHDASKAQTWLSDAQQILGWLQSSGLVDLGNGIVRDGYNGRCKAVGGPLTYTQGEIAEALVRLGEATRQARYYELAAGFLNHALTRSSRMLADGVLQEPCEAERGLCSTGARAIDQTIYKGVLVDAVADWTQATGATTYDYFLTLQARAVLANSASDGEQLTLCQTAHTCQIGFYWARRVAPLQAPMPVNAGTQASGLEALVDGLIAQRFGVG
jgi:hypothetical protein